MRFFTAAFVAVSAFAASVLAQENPISKPTVGSPVTAGQSFPIVWQPTTSGTITLLLRSGPANNLNTIATLVCEFPVPLARWDALTFASGCSQLGLVRMDAQCQPPGRQPVRHPDH